MPHVAILRRPGVWVPGVALVVGLGLTGPLRAQQAATTPPVPKTTVRPDFRNLRFDETWVSAQRTGAWDDQIKAIPLAGDHPLRLTIGGQARWRHESMHAFNLGAQDDDYAQSRLLLSADLLAGDRRGLYGRGFLEARDAQSYGRTLPGAARPNDADRHDWQNAFAEAGVGRTFVRYGRQEIAIGRERLIGVPDWTNTRRGSEGLRVQTTMRRVSLELLDFRPMIVRQLRGNRPDSAARMQSVVLGNATGAARLAWGAPAVWQLGWHSQRILTATSNVRRITTGARAQWQWGAKTLRSFEIEGATQRGHNNDRSLDGWFWVAEAQQQWKRARGTPSLAVGIEEASGERRTTTGTAEAFSNLYPAAHAHGGYADVFGRTNLREWHAIATWLPVRSVDLRLALYRFDRLRLDDGVWTKQNSVLRAAGTSQERHVADEVDLTGSWKASRHLRVIFGGALVPPGAFLRTTGPSRTERWVFTGTTFTF